MDKESGYRPESIRGRRPVEPPQSNKPQPQPEDDTSLWDVVKAPFQGAMHGLLNTGIRTRDQLERLKARQRRGLPPSKKRPFSLNPFRRASSWFKDICERKPLE